VESLRFKAEALWPVVCKVCTEVNSEGDSSAKIPPSLLLAVAITESSLDQYALRVERGFWRRYLEGIKKFVLASPNKVDDKWAKYPDIYSASYGLCQVMLQTALETGWRMKRFPTELLDLATNLRIAAQILQKHQRKGRGVQFTLLRYNGGGDPAYPTRVLQNLTMVKRWGLE
jgi:soluble lytic murein transglycosylase-like protein